MENNNVFATNYLKFHIYWSRKNFITLSEVKSLQNNTYVYRGT